MEDERELVERAREDPHAFGELFDRYYSVILNYVLRRTCDVALAHDITSETFYKALRSIRGFRWRGVSFSAWLYRIASNEIASHYRGRHRLESLDQLTTEHGFDSPSCEDLEAEIIRAQDEVSRHQQYLTCVAALMTVPEKYQTVIALRYFEDKSIAEIVEITGKPQGTVKSLLHRGIERLRRSVENTDYDERNLSVSAALKEQED